MPKFNAQDFLKAGPSIEKNLELPDQLRADPTRLRREFVTIATDPKQKFNVRSRALMVLFRHPTELNALGSQEAINLLMTAFQKEFPIDKLKTIGEAMRGGDCTPDGFIAHLYCIVFATIAPDIAQEFIDAIKTALIGTSLDPFLRKHLDRIASKK